MRILGLLFFFTLQLPAIAQFSKSDAQILDTIEGRKIATLVDSTRISIGPQQSGWYAVTFKAVVPQSQIDGDSILAAETVLLNRDKMEIGKTFEPIKVQYQTIDKRGLRKHYEVLITAYIKGTQLHFRSIPERGLEHIINNEKANAQREKLEEYFEKMGFVQDIGEGFTVWAYLDEPATFGDPTYRCLVLLKGETLLYAVVSRNEIMALDKLKDQRTHNTGNYYFFQRPPDRTWDEITNLVYNYIPL